MKFIKFQTEQADLDLFHHGNVRLKPATPFFVNHRARAHYYNWLEMASIALFLAHPEETRLPEPLKEFGIRFSHLGFDEHVEHLLAPNYWEIPSEKILGFKTLERFFFWSTICGNTCQADWKDVATMLHMLFQPNIIQVEHNLKMVTFRVPELQWNSEGLQGVLLNEKKGETRYDAAHPVRHIIGLPNEYLIDQYASGLDKSGTWKHTDGNGTHVYNGRWETVRHDTVFFEGRTAGAANSKLLKFLRSEKGKEFCPVWAKPDTAGLWFAVAKR